MAPMDENLYILLLCWHTTVLYFTIYPKKQQKSAAIEVNAQFNVFFKQIIEINLWNMIMEKYQIIMVMTQQ